MRNLNGRNFIALCKHRKTKVTICEENFRFWSICKKGINFVSLHLTLSNFLHPNKIIFNNYNSSLQKLTEFMIFLLHHSICLLSSFKIIVTIKPHSTSCKSNYYCKTNTKSDTKGYRSQTSYFTHCLRVTWFSRVVEGAQIRS